MYGQYIPGRGTDVGADVQVPSRFSLLHIVTRAEAIEAFQNALILYSSDARAFDQVRAAIRALACAARRDQVSPEQMLVELKRMLSEAEAFHAASDSTHAVRASLVTTAIRAYYGPAEDGAI